MLCLFKAWQLIVISVLNSLSIWYSMILELNSSCHRPFKLELWHYLLFIVFSKYHLATLVKICGKSFQKQLLNSPSLIIISTSWTHFFSNSEGHGRSKVNQTLLCMYYCENLDGMYYYRNEHFRIVPVLYTHADPHTHTYTHPHPPC